jgi:hypothetical protein
MTGPEVLVATTGEILWAGLGVVARLKTTETEKGT